MEICVRPGVKDTVQNALLRPSPNRSEGTCAIEVTITNHTHPTQQYEQAGITLYNNGEPIFKEVKELIDGDLYIIPGKKPMPTQSVRLRLIITANSWQAQYRPENETEYQTAAEGELPPLGNDQISIQCYNGPEEGDHWIRFSDFCIKRI
ncbi:MAG: hypothetical protein QGG64_04705 [Candidatus Latescibacteria bacterium]|nr:hypothetical protein [Candidatus Latescibacterota bacterium]